MDLNTHFPRLLPGVAFMWQEGYLYLGYRHRGMEIEIAHSNINSLAVTDDESRLTPPILMAALALCQGEYSITDIFRKVLAPSAAHDQLVDLLLRLQSAGFLQMANSSARRKFIRAVNEESQLARALPELNLVRSPQSIRQRGELSILIFGENRLAHHLTMLLRASGFGLVKRIDRREIDRRNTPPITSQITPQEIIGLSFRQSDIGSDRTALLRELEMGVNIHENLTVARTSGAEAFPSIPSFIITTYETQPDYQYRWMNEGIPHLLLSSLADHQIDLGPIVIPGKSACGRCIELAESTINPIYRSWRLKEMHAVGAELSAATVSAIGGLIVLELIQFFSGATTLAGRTKRFDLHDAMSPVDLYWAPHPECGCTELN
jgi:hypothetical protein